MSATFEPMVIDGVNQYKFICMFHKALFLLLSLASYTLLPANPAVCLDEPIALVSETDIALPPPFIDIMRARHDGAFYDRQAREWQAVATGECSSDEAWFHYFKTANYSNRFGSGTYDLKAILAAGEKEMDPGGFDLPYIRFAANKHPTERWADLLIAHANNPDRYEAYSALAAYHESRREIDQRDELLEKMHRLNPIPAGVMEYNYNQLMSTGKNAILLTNGDADTFPSWILQSVYGVRQDVLVVSIPLLRGYPKMRKVLLSSLGLIDPFLADGPVPSVAELLELLTGQSMPIYLAATGRDYLDELPKEKLYLSGLAFYYGNSPIDNLEVLAGNFEGKFRMDQLRQPLSNSPAQAVADQLNQNYLPALLELHDYNQQNPSPRFNQVLPLLRSVAARAGQMEEIDAYLREDDDARLASKNPDVRAKDILKGVVFVPAGIYHQSPADSKISINAFYLQDTEVSNADYQRFLEDLLRQRRFKLLDSVAIASLKIEDIEPASLREKVEGHFNGANAEALGKYPIVNISHKAAELYARWLTEAYNADPKRKDGRNVRFRLPQAEEHAYAARGGKISAPFPWGGPYYRNIKGCLLANFNTFLPESQADFQKFADRVRGKTELKPKQKAELLKKLDCDYEDDGGDFTVMTATEGETIGGSWLDASSYMQIGVTKQRQLPHPSTGFRLVMEYLD